MLLFTESVTIADSPGGIWAHLADIEQWWAASSRDHIRLEIASADKSLMRGTQVDFEERIGGVRMVASGRVVSLHPEVELTWEGTAVYHCLGIRLRVGEGMKWRIATMGDAAIVSASLWVVFPENVIGRLVGWYCRKIRRVVEGGRKHLREELDSLRREVEEAEKPGPVAVRAVVPAAIAAAS